MVVWERVRIERYDKETGKALGVSNLDIPAIDEDRRDYFAAAALTALINSEEHRHMDWDMLAENAYGYADGMLKARSKR